MGCFKPQEYSNSRIPNQKHPKRLYNENWTDKSFSDEDIKTHSRYRKLRCVDAIIDKRCKDF